MGFLVPPGEAVVWRGPMLHGAITQFLRDTAWGELDYLIIDMPPGTGDIALTLSQLLPLSGAVVVCTPQDVALLDAVKAIAMFRKVNIPILGMVENMSGFVCPDCGKRYDIFGSGGAKRRAVELDIPFLGEVPIHISIRIAGDEGRTAANFDDPAAGPYLPRDLRKPGAESAADEGRIGPAADPVASGRKLSGLRLCACASAELHPAQKVRAVRIAGIRTALSRCIQLPLRCSAVS